MSSIIIEIPCRACKAKIRESVSLPYSLDPILQRHGWTHSPDSIGYLCPDHAPGAHQVQAVQAHQVQAQTDQAHQARGILNEGKNHDTATTRTDRKSGIFPGHADHEKGNPRR